MHLLKCIVTLLFINSVICKNSIKKLTESLGQEVIELGNPIKELPQGLEEEPSAENEEENTTTTLQVATKKDTKITTATASKRSQKPGKDIDITDTERQEDEEARIEKELAEIYKDSADYKGDSDEKEENINITSDTSITIATENLKPIGRKGGSFQFQPDSTNNEAIEKFKTSIDEIDCHKVTQKLILENKQSNSSHKIILDVILFISTLFVAN